MTYFLEFYVRLFGVVFPVITMSIFMIRAVRAQLSAWDTTKVILTAALFFGL